MISKSASTRMLGAAALLLWASRAPASADFPAAVQDAAGSPCPPPCTVCHETLSGGYGTINKPFASSMMHEGLEGEDIPLVAPAIEALRVNQIDSDGDGVDDVQELASGRDPNFPGAGDLCGPQYGCGAHVAAQPAVDPYALAVALGVAGALGAQARRRRRQCPGSVGRGRASPPGGGTSPSSVADRRAALSQISRPRYGSVPENRNKKG